ncbi:MAG TPA: ferric reductase-like transmembrane domain-containing protein [Clostridium sp.]
MKKKFGLFIILLSMIITWAFWIFISPTRDIPSIRQYSQLIAAFALVSFAIVNVISTRHKSLDNLFDGLDKSYIYHKYLSISALLMVVLHNVTIGMGKDIQRQTGNRMPGDPYAIFGSISMYLFVIIMLIALLAKTLNYERWKMSHKFMIIPYILGIYHYYGSANYAVFSMDSFSIWMDIVNFTGLIAAIYSIFLYEKIAFRYHYKVKKLEIVATNSLEITGSALGQNINFKPGQFAFLKINNNANKFSSHPFTISQAPKNGELQFTIKVLGDDTKNLIDKLKVGDEFSVAGPHGKFNYKKGAKNQIWIAGGIGITPFRSFLQAGIPKEYSIDFFYAFNNEEEGAYVKELQDLNTSDNLRIHLINAKEKGFLTVDKISKHVKIQETIDVYFCGPKPMREILKKQFSNSQIKIENFYYEHFQFK